MSRRFWITETLAPLDGKPCQGDTRGIEELRAARDGESRDAVADLDLTAIRALVDAVSGDALVDVTARLAVAVELTYGDRRPESARGHDAVRALISIAKVMPAALDEIERLRGEVEFLRVDLKCEQIRSEDRGESYQQAIAERDASRDILRALTVRHAEVVQMATADRNRLAVMQSTATTERDAARAELEHLAMRIGDIADDACGLQPVTNPDALLSIIEVRLAEQRIDYSIASGERDSACDELTELRAEVERMRVVVEAVRAWRRNLHGAQLHYGGLVMSAYDAYDAASKEKP